VRRRKGLPTEDLLQEVRGMLGGAGRAIDGRALVDACDLLLARTLEPDARAEALLARGVGQRVLGDRAKEEASFREALELAGPTTPRGREARSQLAWTAARGGDARAAADAFAGLASETDAPERQRAWNRLYAAQHYGRAGDRERERAAYRAVTEEFGATDDVDAKRAVEQARRWLERP
jgi:hypothetical protein